MGTQGQSKGVSRSNRELLPGLAPSRGSALKCGGGLWGWLQAHPAQPCCREKPCLEARQCQSSISRAQQLPGHPAESSSPLHHVPTLSPTPFLVPASSCSISLLSYATTQPSRGSTRAQPASSFKKKINALPIYLDKKGMLNYPGSISASGLAPHKLPAPVSN